MANKTQLAELDDLLIKKLPICISTEENNYKYTLSIKYNEIYAFNNISLKLFKKSYAYEHSDLLAYSYSRIIKKKLQEELFDVIFAPVASTELAFLPKQIPIIYTADATFSLISNYYPDYFSGQLRISIEEGNYI